MAWSKIMDDFTEEWHHGLGLYVYPTKRFKTVTLYAAWIRDLDPEGRALGAMLPHVLKRGTERWVTHTLMEQQLEELYGANFRADVGKLGDKQLLSFHITVVNGGFLPGNPDTVAGGLDFLTQVLEHPHLVQGQFPGDVVQQEKELIKRQISAQINDKGQYALSRLVELIADGQAFGLKKLGTHEEVDRVTPEQLVDFFEQVQSQSPFVFLAVGDVDPDVIQRHIEKRWGHRERQRLTTIAPNAGQHAGHTVIERQRVRQGKLNLGYRTGITAKDVDFPALMMYAGVLGGFSHSKLFLHVREKASLAYYAYARLEPTLALMIIGAGIEFKDYEAARRIIEEQVNAIRRGEISADEMAFTLKGYVNDMLSEEDSPGQLIGRQLEHLLIGGGLSGPGLIRALERVAIDDIVRVAQGVLLDTVYFLTEDGGAAHDA